MGIRRRQIDGEEMLNSIKVLGVGINGLLVLGAIGWLAGCGGNEGPQRYRMQGTVEFDGKPVPSGMIYFDPDASKENKGPQGFASIVAGKFDTRNGGQGHIGGPMKIRIVGLSAVPTATGDDTPKPALFPEFQEVVQLDKSDGTRAFVVPKESGSPQ